MCCDSSAVLSQKLDISYPKDTARKLVPSEKLEKPRAQHIKPLRLILMLGKACRNVNVVSVVHRPRRAAVWQSVCCLKPCAHSPRMPNGRSAEGAHRDAVLGDDVDEALDLRQVLAAVERRGDAGPEGLRVGDARQQEPYEPRLPPAHKLRQPVRRDDVS